MKISCVIFAFFAWFVGMAYGKDATPRYGFPQGSVIIETEFLKSKGYPNRAIVLWMLNPTKQPSEAQGDLDYLYNCPEYTRGSYYSGPTRVSLLDTTKNIIINTIEIADSFDIPYAIRKGYYYQVWGNPGKRKEGKAHILSLKDYNGDGRSLEFALFDAQACMGLSTTLIGYSTKQDKIIQYPIWLKVNGDNEHTVRKSGWCDYLFSEKPQSPGFWRYTIDYRGRMGPLDKYEIKYNPKQEKFEGTLVWTEDEKAE